MKNFFGMLNDGKDLSENEMVNLVNEISNVFGDGKFENAFNSALEEALLNPKSTDEIYDELIDYYFLLLNLLDIFDFKKIHFPDYKDCRRISIDNKEYDFNDCFEHDDNEAAETLCAIDCLIADLQNDGEKSVLKKVENKINKSR